MLFTFILGLMLGAPPKPKVKPPLKVDTSEILYKVNKWIDTSSDLDDYDKMEERSHQRDKRVGKKIWPTVGYGPFIGGDWCLATRKEEDSDKV